MNYFTVVETAKQYLAVSESWLNVEQSKCRYPKNLNDLKQCLSGHKKPEDDWKQFAVVKVHGIFAKLDDAIAKAQDLNPKNCTSVDVSRSSYSDDSLVEPCAKRVKEDLISILLTKNSKALKQQKQINKELEELKQIIENFSGNKDEAHEVEGRLTSYLPLESKDLELFEQKLKKEKNALSLQNYIKDIGGKTYQCMIKYALENMISSRMAARYSLTGRSAGSKAFCKLRIAKCLKKAVTEKFPNADEKAIDDYTSSWFSNMKQKVKKAALSSSGEDSD